MAHKESVVSGVSGVTDETPAPAVHKDITMPVSTKANILIIDDEYGPRESIRVVLSGEYNCIIAESGEQGVSALDNNPVDLIILDIKMPGLDGIETLELIRKKKPDVKVILLTGYGTLDSAQKAIRLGAFDYLKKPFDIKELRAVVSKGLKARFEEQKAKEHVGVLEGTLSRMQTSVAQNDRMSKLGTLSAGIIHEMKNPLTVILGYTQMILSTLKKDNKGEAILTEKAVKQLSVIEQETMHCADIAKKLLSVSRSGNDTPVKTDICDIVKNTEILVKPQCSVNQIRIDTQVPEDSLYVNAVPGEIHDILLNLCINSMHAMGPSGKIVLKLYNAGNAGRELKGVTAEEKDYLNKVSDKEILAIEVEDTGTGIPEEIRHKVFNAFFTTKDGEKGTGLGLYLSREKAQKNSGFLDLVRTGITGTVFRFLIPAAG